LDGQSAGDEFGNEVAFNKVGDIMAVGARYDDPNGAFSGEVFVYQWQDTAWVQYGNSITGESGDDRFGWDVALNASGDRLIVGAIFDDANGSNSGQVRIYSFDNGVWRQLGQDINGGFANDYFGFSVDINAVGNRIVVGALYNDVNGSNSGQATIYELVNGLWVQLGASLDGAFAGDQFGVSVAINDLGDKVVIGANTSNANGPSSGQVSVYGLVSGTWTQLGTDIDGAFANDEFGFSVDINAAGDRIVVGARLNDVNGSNSGQATIYEYSSGSWLKLGNDINGESSDDRFGYAVAMNDLGDRIVVGAYLDDGNGSNSGHVRVYEISGSLWEQLGFDLDGEAANDYSGISVAMNAVGDRVASGAIYNDGGGSNSGHVRVYETPVICPLPLAIVLQQQEDPTFTYSSSSYCSIEADPTPTITGASGGTFTSTSGLVINSSTGAIDLDASTPGVYDVTYTTSGSTPGSCAGVLTQRLIISATTTDFNYTATTFCINDTNPKATITGVLNGKFSSSTGLVIDPSTGTINLLASTPGNYNVSYTPPSNFN